MGLTPKEERTYGFVSEPEEYAIGDSGMTCRCGAELVKVGCDGEYCKPYYYCPTCQDHDYDVNGDVIGIHGYEN